MTTDVPTLATVAEATDMLRKLAADHDWVSVFWDRGWGDSGQTADITIIVDGDGQNPHARITDHVYRQLLTDGTIAANSLTTYKARKLHDYKAPPAEEADGPDTTELAEQAVRRYMADHPAQPIRADFYRGPGSRDEIFTTPAAADGWYVHILPGFADAAISAKQPGFLGPDIIGGGRATTFDYPTGADGEVDVDALTGDAFQRLLAEKIGEKLAVIESTRKAAVR